MKRKQYTRGPITLDELMSNTVTRSNGCIEWTKSTARNGYGMLRRNGRAHTVSRLVMHLTAEFDLNDSRHILHRCDNPPCINPDHLFIGTASDNAADKVKKDRHNRGERTWKTVLTPADVIRIRELSASGISNLSMAKDYGVTTSAIYAVVNRINWKHI